MQNLKRFVGPPLSDARVARLWPRISQRVEMHRPRRAKWWALGFAGAALIAMTALATRSWLVSDPPARPVLADARLETAADTLAVTLVDGSSVKLSARTRIELRGSDPRQVKLALENGEIACNVTHREDRSFVVAAAGVEVRVVGTEFAVRADQTFHGPRVEVRVTRGAVEVRSEQRPGVVARVAAGETWVQAADPADVPPLAPPSTTSTTPPAVPTPAPVSGVNPPPGARELFERASERRRAGDAAGAAQAYDELLRRFPGDGRAALSAFELGRLRLDRLGEPAAAVGAFERALALGNGASFREDALARLVVAHTRLGDVKACERTRARYLKSYPNGVHAGAESMRCGGR